MALALRKWRGCFASLPLFYMLVLVGGFILQPSVAIAEHSTVHTYFLQEPVFDGKARIVEAGDEHHPLIVLVHGLNDSADAWRSFIPALAQNFHVISFDLPGFGQSTKANKLYSPDNYVKFIRYVVSKFRHTQMILVGHSMGANIALRYAATYPQQVERLILIDVAGILHRLAYTRFLAHFGIQTLPRYYPEQQTDLKTLADSLFGALADYSSLLEQSEYYVLSEPELREKLMGGYPPAIAAHAMMLTDFSKSLERFAVPTLLLWGGQDQITPLRTAKVLAANLNNSGLVIFEKAGHNPLLDVPRLVENWLVQFASASPAQRDEILQQHRYLAPLDAQADANRIGNCRDEQNKVFRGRYKLITLEHCHNVLLQDVVADSVTVIDSQVTLENCVLSSAGKSLLLQNSEIQITACRIQGSPAIEISNSKLDMAGSRVSSDTDAIKAGATKTTQATTTATNSLLFSVSKLTSRYQTRLLHGAVSLSPGQGL